MKNSQNIPEEAEKTISVDETAHRLKICVGSVLRLIREGVLPAKQLMPSAPWQVPVAALDTESVRISERLFLAKTPRCRTMARLRGDSQRLPFSKTLSDCAEVGY